jgi:membrane carboxypeptidase/penicillin-binding protein
MVTGKQLRAIPKLAVLSVIAILTAAVVQFAWAYLATPEIVAQFEASTPLPLDPATFTQERRDWLLAVGDPTFYHHHGVDTRTRGAGYTTITQGLVKILFFDNFQPGLFRWRKVKQTIIALAFDARVAKDKQLRLFVNAVYLGNRNGHDVIGFASASEEYFGKPFLQVSDAEYLELVAMIVGPDKFSLATHPDRNHERVQRIRRLLAGECKPNAVKDVEYADCAR